MTKFMEKKIIKKFGNRLRIRVCGILVEDDRLLLVKHRSLGPRGVLWTPPGGGMHFGKSASENLVREFEEETGLKIKVGQFLFAYEFLQPPLHAIELFFQVKRVGGDLRTGADPEMGKDGQIIEEVAFIRFHDMDQMERFQVHQVLWDCRTHADLIQKKGYIKIK
jgi:8-oxo-dGTP diphosphatase